MPSRLGAALVVEFIGTFALVFCGIMVFNYGKPEGLAGLLTIAFGHGLILSTMVTAAMPVSGGALNPAITFGLLITGKLPPVNGIAYIVIELLAGVAAGLMALVVHPVAAEGGQFVLIGVTDFGQLSPMLAALIEAIATFFLSFAVWGSAIDPRAKGVGGFAIGLTVAADILAFGPLTNASMNTARSFGPMLVASMTPAGAAAPWLWSHQWVYWVGPMVGAGLAAIIYNSILLPKEKA